MSHPGRTLFDKIWDAHVVRSSRPEVPPLLRIDLHLVHEVTSPQAFAGLRARGLGVAHPERTFATMDHSTPTLRTGGALRVVDAQCAAQLESLRTSCAEHGIELAALGDERNGIVHVVGPELGLTQPGMTIVCGDSHTSTHGAFGALAFGIGTSQVEHVLATQHLFQTRPKTMRVWVEGHLAPGVSAKDLVLAVIAEIGVDGGTGHVIEYAGPAIEALDMEGRMTVCNMSIEAGARAGMIAPDEVTFAYLRGRERAPRGEAWDAVAQWRALRSDPDAAFDREVRIDGAGIRPRVTFGTHPGMGVAIDQPIPDGADLDPAARRAHEAALAYMGLDAGAPLLGHPVDVVFVGSCTNGRLSDLRAAAGPLRGARVHERVRMLVVPGSVAVKRAAEAEGLDRVFLDAGAEWRDPGCSMCIAMNGDQLSPGQLALSTSNRNFEGRQGKGGRTVLCSPATAAASAVAGRVTAAEPESKSESKSQSESASQSKSESESESESESKSESKSKSESQSKARSEFKTEGKGKGRGKGTEWSRAATLRVALLLHDAIDTDQIIPARFLKVTTREGLGAHLFADWPEAAHVRTATGAEPAALLVGQNFGCGSSREHAPWALVDAGYRAILARSFADIFRANAIKNGLLPIELDAATHREVLGHVERGGQVTIDLAHQTLRAEREHRFEVEAFGRHLLLEGLDELDAIAQVLAEVRA